MGLKALAGTVAALGSGLLLQALWVAQQPDGPPELLFQPTDFNQAVMSRCATMRRVYKRLRYLWNGHVETIFAAKLRRAPVVVYQRECVQMQDGGTVAVDVEVASPQQDLPADAPVLLLLPGLTGGSHDAYVRHMVGAARAVGIRAVVFNSRGTSDSPVTSPQFYSASFTGDMREVVALLRQRYPASLLLAAGWSLGANILVRYLGEEGEHTPIAAAVSMCNPFDLVVSDANFQVGFNRIYDANLAASLRNIYARHAALFQDLGGEYQPRLAGSARTIREFDDALTRVSFGWPSVDAYYAGSSSAPSIPQVRIPLLCIQAIDDPIAPAKCIPFDAIRQNPHCVLVVTPAGGHLGWCAGPEAPLGAPWTDQAVVEWLTAVQLELYRAQAARLGQQQQQQNGASATNGAEARKVVQPVLQQQEARAVFTQK